VTSAAPFTHVLADYLGVTAARAADAPLLSGLLIAAAGAAGLSTSGTPAVHLLPSGSVTALLLLDGGHVALHTHPDRGIVLLDILAPAGIDLRKAVDVLERRLEPAAVRQASRGRGAADPK
jgi:S-adenosylmethionine/arginine decarboxylase-like enzyme